MLTFVASPPVTGTMKIAWPPVAEWLKAIIVSSGDQEKPVAPALADNVCSNAPSGFSRTIVFAELRTAIMSPKGDHAGFL